MRNHLEGLFILLSACAALSASRNAPASVLAQGSQNPPAATVSAGPTREQLQTLLAHIVEHQHRNDRAMEQFERYERVVVRGPDQKSGVLSDRVDRVIPSGTGTMRLPVFKDGKEITPDAQRRQLEGAIQALEIAIHPNDRYLQDTVKFDKRRRERAEMLDNAAKAFTITWGGREARGQRAVVKLVLDPDPHYKPVSRLTGAFEHVRVKLWVDEQTEQIVRLEGDVISDITFGGGLFGKVYKGSRFGTEQAEVEPGLWLPTLYAYDVSGRKFIFGFESHERTDAERYRRVGPPAQSIEILRRELDRLRAEVSSR